MSDWEADDFDPSAQVTDKIVTLGLEVKKDNLKTDASKTGELSEREKRELQLQSDVDISADLLGLQTNKKKQFEDFHRANEFVDYANELGAQFSGRAKHEHYLLFVNGLVGHLVKPMNKLQLQTIRETVQGYLNVIEKREEEEKKHKQEIKEKTQAKKKTKKMLYEDTVEDDYDDAKYDKEFSNYF